MSARGLSEREDHQEPKAERVFPYRSLLYRFRAPGERVVMLDTTNVLLTFAGLNGALTCLTLWKISREEAKKGGKLEWNLRFRKPRKPTKQRAARKKRPRTRTRRRPQRQVKPMNVQEEVDILPPQYDYLQTKTRDETHDELGPYLEGEWEVIN